MVYTGTYMKKENMVLLLGMGGLLFSGYLAGTKFFTDTCAFGEACPIFLGLPACYFGFFMFLAIFGTALLRYCNKVNAEKANEVILTVSGVGILFAGYFTLLELPLLFNEGLTAYVLGLPTCALGFIFYIITFILSYRLR